MLKHTPHTKGGAMPTDTRRDEDYAELITKNCMSGDYEADHVEADDLLCSLLLDLGYRETVDAWRKVGKWWA